MTVEWEPGKPWTHPSIQRLTLAQMRERYADQCLRNEEDRAQYGSNTSDDVRELLALGQERADTFLRAIEQRESEAAP